jgi:mRNA interferase MazF
VVITRGGIHWVELGPVLDGVPAKRRPVLVVQSDNFNASRIATVVVCAITSNTAVAGLPGNVFVPAAASGLSKDSVVNVSQLITLDKARLGSIAGTIPVYALTEVEAGLRTVLALR